MEPVNVTLLERRVFPAAMKLRISKVGEHLGLTVWTLNAITSVLIRERQRKTRHTEGKTL